MPRSLYFVEQHHREAVAIDVVSSLLGLSPTRFLTAEAALEAVEARPPDLLATDLILPGLDGLSLIRTIKSRSPRTRTVLLTEVRPAFADGAEKDLGVDAVIVKRGPWTSELAALIASEGETDPEALAVLEAIERGESGFDAMVSWLGKSQLSVDRERLTLRYIAGVFEPDRVTAALERVVLLDSRGFAPAGGGATPHAELHAVALDVAVTLGGVGFEVVREIAESAASPQQVRARAMRHLARHFPHHAVLPVFWANLRDADPLIRLDAAHAALDSASKAGGEGFSTLVELLENDDLDEDLRVSALKHMSRLFTRAEVRPHLEAALKSRDALLVHAASALAMQSDGLDVDTLVDAARSGPVQARLTALSQLAVGFPKAAVVPVFEHFQGDPEPRIRHLAYELFMRLASAGFEATLARAAADGAPAQRAALLGAQSQGTLGFDAVAAVAERTDGDPQVRAMAARLIGLQYPLGLAAPVLSRLVVGRTFEVASGALLGALQLRSGGYDVLRRAQTASPIPAVRELALCYLDEHAPLPVFNQALRRSLSDPDLAVQSKAVEIAIRRAGGDFPPFLNRLAERGEPTLQQAGLDGALQLREAGFGLLLGFAKHPQIDVEVRRRAAKVLRHRHDLSLPELPSDTAQDPDTLPGAPADLVETDAERPAGSKPLHRLRVKSLRPPVVVPSAPTPAAWRAAEPAANPAANGNRREQTTAAAVAATPPAPATPPPTHRPQIELARARRALEAAVRAGQDGFKAITRLADSARVPEEVRAQALRHLAADFPRAPEVRPILERAMADASERVRSTGLACSMLRKDTRLEPIERLVRDEGGPPNVRARAVRYLSGAFDKPVVHPILEDLFEQPDREIRRAALESMFPSIKYVPADRVESHLCNLLTEHENPDVKVSAAKALGAFGAAEARSALDRFTGIFADGYVKDAAKHALARVQTRLRR